MEPVIEPSRYCLTCYYVLDGLPENRCPECGRPFDPACPESYSTDPAPSRFEPAVFAFGRALVFPPVAILLFWASFALAPCLPLGGIVGVVSIGRTLARRRWVQAITTLVLCLAPAGFLFARGVADYLHGTGALWYPAGTEFFNIDSTYRCSRHAGDCLVQPVDEVVNALHNAGLKMMILIFGPMPGSYVGPYPTKQEALQALTASEPVDYDALVADQVRLSARTITLDAGVGKQLLQQSSWRWHPIRGRPNVAWLIKSQGPITGAVWQDCLLLRVPSDEHTLEDGPPSAMIVVIDPASGRPFAYYAEGDYSQRPPPVRWHR